MSILKSIDTEKRNIRSINFDTMSIKEAVDLMISEEYFVIKALEQEAEKITSAIEITSSVLANNGRIVYIGAGTSGRLGVLDAVECPPTFGVDYDTVIGLIAGGKAAISEAVEGAEDNKQLAVEDLKNIKFNKNDVLVGIAASGRTPYVIAALEYAQEINAESMAISCTKNAKISDYANLSIEVFAQAEVLTGSTRLKSGTLQKLILNMISTISMRSLDKIYQNLMIDVKPTNDKLLERAKQIIVDITGIDYSLAGEYLLKSKNSVKLAIVMINNQCSYQQALEIIDSNNQAK